MVLLSLSHLNFQLALAAQHLTSDHPVVNWFYPNASYIIVLMIDGRFVPCSRIKR